MRKELVKLLAVALQVLLFYSCADNADKQTASAGTAASENCC